MWIDKATRESISLVSTILFLVLGDLFTSDKWLKSPYSSYEYTVIYFDLIDFSEQLERCRDVGGELAYAGLDDIISWK